MTIWEGGRANGLGKYGRIAGGIVLRERPLLWEHRSFFKFSISLWMDIWYILIFIVMNNYSINVLISLLVFHIQVSLGYLINVWS